MSSICECDEFPLFLFTFFSRVLTTLDLRANDLGDEAKGVIRDAVSGRKGFKLEM